MSEDPRCKGCGGPLFVRSGQTMIMGTTTVTYGGDEVVEERTSDEVVEERTSDEVVEERTSDDCWCGDCVDAWNAALHA